jgi:hypothetical protein
MTALPIHSRLTSEPNYQSLPDGLGGHGAIALITRATPRLATTIEMVNLCIESTLSSEHPNPMSALKYGHHE